MKTILAILVLLTVVGVSKAEDFATASFKWDANKETDIAGYSVYYSRTEDMNNAKVSGFTSDLRITFSNISAGKPYYFAVKAKNTSGAESNFSNTVYYKQPTMPLSFQLFINQLVIQ